VSIRTNHTLRNIDGLAIIGRTKHALMGIRYEDGEGGDVAAVAAAAAKLITDKATADAQAIADKAPWTKENFDPERAQRLVENLRADIAAAGLTKAQADIKAGQISTTVAILAHGLGGSPKLLLANEKFKASIASVEPTDEAAITAIITAELQANPALKATPPSSGSDGHQGGQILNLEALLAKATKDGDVA